MAELNCSDLVQSHRKQAQAIQNEIERFDYERRTYQAETMNLIAAEFAGLQASIEEFKAKYSNVNTIGKQQEVKMGSGVEEEGKGKQQDAPLAQAAPVLETPKSSILSDGIHAKTNVVSLLGKNNEAFDPSKNEERLGVEPSTSTSNEKFVSLLNMAETKTNTSL